MAPTEEVSSFSGRSHISFPQICKKLFLSHLASLLIALVIAAPAGVTAADRNNAPTLNYPHSIIKSACSSTLHPELCFSAIASSPELSSKITNHNDVIVASLNMTITSAKQNFKLIERVPRTRAILTKRQKIALQDCLQLLDDTLEELHQTLVDFTKYPNVKSLSEHADNLKTFLSSAITNQETCLDGFSHSDADRKVREELFEAEIQLRKLCSNALAMIKHKTDTDMVVEAIAMTTKARQLQEKQYDDHERGWPKWLSERDSWLLQGKRVIPNVVVAADGSGDFATVSEAVEAAPNKTKVRYVIKIKAGTYKENVEVPSSKPNLMFLGEGEKRTIITGNRSVKGTNHTTFNSATVAINGKNFLARDITFINTAGPKGEQAVALRVSSDFSAFYKCKFIACQDTLYVHRDRQFFSDCTVYGTVDFIFGNAAAVLQNCDIRPRKPGPNQQNMVTAQGRTDPNQNTGIVIQKSKIRAASDLKPVLSDFPTYLGRPWKEHSRTVVMQSLISHVIQPAGWYRWNDSDFGLATCEYREYKNFGVGADTSNRVNWGGYKVITNATEAKQYTAGEFIAGGGWLNSTGFPYTLGL